jgi:spore germination cell wall hydrolase CwlJ-like protein
MERDLDILTLRQQVEEQEQTIQPQIQQQVWRYGEKPIKTPRVTQQMTQSSQNMTQSSIQNKKFTRDAINTRMGDRDMLAQVGGNPFLSNNNYVNDIANRDQYLLARDSNFN